MDTNHFCMSLMDYDRVLQLPHPKGYVYFNHLAIARWGANCFATHKAKISRRTMRFLILTQGQIVAASLTLLNSLEL